MSTRAHLISLAFAALIAMPTYAQKVQPTVLIHTERLSQEERDYFVNVGNELTTLIRDHNWTDGKYRYNLPVQVDIFFDKYVRVGAIHRYTAGVLVALKNGIQIRDRRWEFQYTQDFRLHMGEPYDTFTGMIEYCTNLCLGFEADRIAPLGGDPYYRKALQIGELARSEALYSTGWDDRREFAFDINDTTYTNIRTARFHAEAGTYFAGKENWEKAEAHLTKTVELLLKCSPSHAELHRGDYILRFVDLDVVVKALRDSKMKAQLRLLEDWDNENPDRYR